MGEMNRARMQQRESRHFTPQHAAKVDAQSARANSFLGAHAESSNKSFVGMLGDEFMKDVNSVTQRTVQKGKEFIHDPVAFMKSAETESLLSPLKSALGLGMWVANESRHNSAVEAYNKFREGDGETRKQMLARGNVDGGELVRMMGATRGIGGVLERGVDVCQGCRSSKWSYSNCRESWLKIYNNSIIGFSTKT